MYLNYHTVRELQGAEEESSVYFCCLLLLIVYSDTHMCVPAPVHCATQMPASTLGYSI